VGACAVGSVTISFGFRPGFPGVGAGVETVGADSGSGVSVASLSLRGDEVLFLGDSFPFFFVISLEDSVASCWSFPLLKR